ncbi:MAG: AmpG family muropeptide MFS transporter [Chlorobi bacterium]|nr:AmpG family muropeptide MFS transporter [Chlorobiota bacterium]
MWKLTNTEKERPWLWVPSLYFAEGIPYVIVMTLSVIFYKRMGVSNTDIALYTSWLYLPWVIKPLWSPMVDILKTKRYWIILMQLFIGAGLAGVALTMPLPDFFKYTLAFFWLLAFSSATHDIAADGFYMLGLSTGKQAFFVGIRSTFYRLAMLTGQGLLVILAGYFESQTSLNVVNLNVKTVKHDKVYVFVPDTIKTINDSATQHVVSPNEISIALGSQTRGKAKELLHKIDEWNIKNKFYKPDVLQTNRVEKNTWWQAHVSGKLASLLKKYFGKNKSQFSTNKVGNIGYAWFYLSQKPDDGETVVFNLSWEKGNKNIQLVKSYRFEFNNQNWNKPAFAAIQIDPKLTKTVSASFKGTSGNIRFAWTIVFMVIAAVFLLFFLYHRIVLPKPISDKSNLKEDNNIFREFVKTFVLFFRKKNIGIILLFLLIYRLGESQLVKLASPFLLDAREAGGLGLTTGDLGLLYGTIGIIFLSLGGILGGIVASNKGLKYWIWYMALAMNLPNLVYVYLSYAMPHSLFIIGASVAVEQFGYGFGFTAYMLYMIYVSDGEFKTAHFAITTGFMALGMMIPGMISGWLQEIVGYGNFFIWVIICSIPIFLILPFIKIDKSFGIKENKQVK